ncbi:ArsR/SmtB family transcription factor [Kocuria rosea]|uniref:ArsR/SmtB family transcription factor n=1 Tax=Kocuria rosea TaxID=1275 RepID=UPI00339ABD67
MALVPSVVRPAGQSELVAQAAKVFGNTVRLSIIHALGHGPALRAELVAQTGLPAKTIGAQLTELEAVGAVKAEAQHGRGRPMLYYANQAQLEELLSALAEYVLGGVADKSAEAPAESH